MEVVATDGPISSRRQEALYRLTDVAGFDRAQVAFVTAYRDRGARGFRSTMSDLAWNSFVWFASEPENIVHLNEGRQPDGHLSE